MDKFLKIVYQLHYEKECGDEISNLLTPVKVLLEEKIEDKEVLDMIEEQLVNCLCEARDYFGVDGMKLATDIINNKYTPTI